MLPETCQPEPPAVIEIRGLEIDHRYRSRFTIRGMFRGSARGDDVVLHAVRGVDLTVREGEVLGLVGGNGAGKTTLLKAVAGIFRPDRGSIDTKGRHVSLLSLGAGFRRDLSGRENILLAGLLLRYPAAYVREKQQEIIDLSELGAAVDRPVYTYTDEMCSRLCFAVTAVLETDILLIDELPETGDERFRKKSLRKIRELVSREGVTGIVVSRDMELIRSICTRAAWMREGKICASGDPERIAGMYLRNMGRAAEPPSATDRDGGPDGPRAGDGEKIRMYRGLDIRETNGLPAVTDENTQAERSATAVNWEPLHAAGGTRIVRKREDIRYRVFFYEERIPEELIYTSAMSADGTWMLYDRERSDADWRDEPSFAVPEACFLRIAVRAKEGKDLEGPLFLEDLFSWEERPAEPVVFGEEIRRTAGLAAAAREPDDPLFFVIADTHAAFGGTWTDTAENIRRLAGAVRPDFVVHLGDLTDGTLPEAETARLLRLIRKDLESTGAPAVFCAGNHDLGRLPGQSPQKDPRAFFRKAAGQEEDHACRDLPEQQIRLLFLSSYDPFETDPYGFSEAEVKWTEEMLAAAPEGYAVLVFSHVSPAQKMTRWGEPVRNSAAVMRVLETYQRERGGILGVIHGHDHRDRTDESGPFPVIGIGCAKLENKENSPLHTGRFLRKQGTVSQELFDLVVVKRKEGRLERIRFGAGGNGGEETCADRSV